MQLGLPTNVNHSMKPASLARGNVTQSQNVKHNLRSKESSNQSNFPESALLSTRPVRYNIQLNQQLTAVQLSDNYLSQVENKLLQLSHTALHSGRNKNANAPLIKQQLTDLSTVLEKRQALSANTVDRQLNVVLSGSPKVNFTIKGAENWLQQPDSETLMFLLAGEQRELTTVKFQPESSPNDALRQLNLGLGKFGIHGSLQDKQLVFSVDEQKWARINQNLTVRGEGYRYPQGEFFRVNSQAQSDIKEVLDGLMATPATLKKRVDEIQQTLEHVTSQRRVLSNHKDNVQQRIEGMATFQGKGMALQASAILKDQLASSTTHYETLLQATAGQANIHRNVVKNLLSEF